MSSFFGKFLYQVRLPVCARSEPFYQAALAPKIDFSEWLASIRHQAASGGPILPVKAAELNGFQNMLGTNDLRTVQIRNSAGNFDKTVIGTGGHS